MIIEGFDHRFNLLIKIEPRKQPFAMTIFPCRIECHSKAVGIVELTIVIDRKTYQRTSGEMPGPRFELGTRRFSVACSTN